MTTNPHYIPTGHPVRALLRAATGHQLSRADLSRLTEWDEHLPPGSSLSRYGRHITDAAAQVRALADAGNLADARRLADDTAARLAGSMTDAERAVSGDANPEALDDITRRMFGPY